MSFQLSSSANPVRRKILVEMIGSIYADAIIKNPNQVLYPLPFQGTRIRSKVLIANEKLNAKIAMMIMPTKTTSVAKK